MTNKFFYMCYTGYEDSNGKPLFSGNYVLLQDSLLEEGMEQVGRVFLHVHIGFIVIFDSIDHNYVFSLPEIHNHLEKLQQSQLY